MTLYSEKTSRSLLTDAVDLEGDPIAVRRINGDVITTWPHIVSLPSGTAIITELGQVTYDDGGARSDHPAEGATISNGSFTFRLWDGRVESPDYTASIDLTGLVETDPGYVSDPVFRLAADRNVIGNPVTAWAATVGSAGFTPIGTPDTGLSPSGVPTVVIGSDEGFTASAAGLPTGAAARTMQVAIRFTPGQSSYAGFGYGTNTASGAFTVSVDIAGDLSLDVFGTQYVLGAAPLGEWAIITAAYDGSTLDVWLGRKLAFTIDVELSTGDTLINLARSFSGNTTTCEFGEALIYDRALTHAEIAENIDYLNGRFIDVLSIADHAPVTIGAINGAGFAFHGNATGNFGIIQYRITQTANNALIDTGIVSLDGSSAFSVTVSGLQTHTAYTVTTTEFGLIGQVSNESIAQATTTDTLSLKDELTLLRDDLSTNGRTSTASLTTPTTGNLPNGVNFNSNGVINWGASGTFQNWNFMNRKVDVLPGTDVIFEQCLFGQDDIGSMLSTGGGVGEYLDAQVGAEVAVRWSTFKGPFAFNGPATAINGARNNLGTANVVPTSIYEIGHCRMYGLSADSIKLLGTNIGQPQHVHHCYFGPASYLSGQWRETGGSRMWSSGTTYAQNDYVLFRKSNSQIKAFRSRHNNNTGNNPQNVSASWKEQDPHADVFTTVAGVNGIEINDIYAEYLEVPAASDVLAAWQAAGSPANYGMNNILRAVTNTGKDDRVDYTDLRRAILDRERDLASYPIQWTLSGNPNIGPHRIADVWISHRNGSSNNRYVFEPVHNLTLWDTIRDLDTNAIIARPAAASAPL